MPLTNNNTNTTNNTTTNTNNNVGDTDVTHVTKTGQPELYEPLLIEPLIKKRTILPVQYPDLWKMYKEHEAAIWHAHEVKLQQDLPDWLKLTADEQHFVKYILAFFASSDLIVAENIAERFLREVKITEVKTFYAFQMMMENIHSEVYANMIITYITNPKEQDELLNAVDTIPCIKKKAAWAQKWIESESSSFAERLVAFACVEGIFFSGAFCCIYWLTEKGRMRGLAMGNDFIARDEARHTDFACLLYKNYIVNKLSQEHIEEIIKSAVDIEIEFITEALPCRLVGMNATSMKNYIKFVANRLVAQLGYKPIYLNDTGSSSKGQGQPITHTFDFMNKLGMDTRCNFFEETPTQYSKINNESTTEDPFSGVAW